MDPNFQPWSTLKSDSPMILRCLSILSLVFGCSWASDSQMKPCQAAGGLEKIRGQEEFR